MPGTYRERNQSTGSILVGSMTPINPTGAVQYFSNPDVDKDTKLTRDYIGNRKGFNTFYTRSIKRNRGCFSGPQLANDGTTIRVFSNWPIAHNPSDSSPWPALPDLTVLDFSNMAWEAMGKTNPSVAPVNAFQMVGELKDLPSLVKDWGGNLLRKVAKGHITYRFALKPMVSDVLALCNFQEQAERRFNEIKKLKEGKTIRKRCSLRDTSTSTKIANLLLQSQWAGITGTQTNTLTEKVWATCQWKMADSNQWLPSLNNGSDLRRLARRTVMGLNSYGGLKAAWELLPWSWFVDWFWNIGRLIDATNNSLGLQSANICVMRTRQRRLTYSIESIPGNLQMSRLPAYSFTYKERHLVTPLLPLVPVTLNVLSNSQWSILADLAVLRTGSK